MKIKLDENLGAKVQEVFSRAGHDVETVHDEGLAGSSDEIIHKASQNEGRILITLDHDFGNILRFPPDRSAGIVLIENPVHTDYPLLISLAMEAAEKLKTHEIAGKLWIVQAGRIRERPAWSEEDDF